MRFSKVFSGLIAVIAALFFSSCSDTGISPVSAERSGLGSARMVFVVRTPDGLAKKAGGEAAIQRRVDELTGGDPRVPVSEIFLSKEGRGLAKKATNGGFIKELEIYFRQKLAPLREIGRDTIPFSCSGDTVFEYVQDSLPVPMDYGVTVIFWSENYEEKVAMGRESFSLSNPGDTAFVSLVAEEDNSVLRMRVDPPMPAAAASVSYHMEGIYQGYTYLYEDTVSFSPGAYEADTLFFEPRLIEAETGEGQQYLVTVAIMDAQGDTLIQGSGTAYAKIGDNTSLDIALAKRTGEGGTVVLTVEVVLPKDLEIRASQQ